MGIIAIWVGPGFPFLSDEIDGPGFRAFAGDWPEGTRLEITARILPPAGEADDGERERHDPECPGCESCRQDHTGRLLDFEAFGEAGGG